ncbi:MAG TPA: FMN-binding glutamate synthase family protein [Firmicutes bacterium]|nr:FMN-binding glutamate synthase family protein [Bacillota bacterium]
MSYSKGINSSAATLTKNRVPGSVCPATGLCVTCVDGCTGLCEVGKSAIRGREVIYPKPFGTMTTGSEKDYPVDLSHFTIMGTAAGAWGIEADSDKALFPAVNVETQVGGCGEPGLSARPIKLKIPFFVAALGSTRVAKDNWDGLAIGSAISGTILTIGENVAAMDPDAEIKGGRVVNAPDLARRVKLFKDWQDGYGTIVVQANVEDTRLGVQEYAIEKLGVEAVEIKWGQGAKDIGGEVKLPTLERALQLKSRGYVVLPDPEDEEVQAAFKRQAFKEFERHSRIGMVDHESFISRVNELRRAGAKYVFLKTGAYRPVDLARALAFASEARIDLVTVDGAGGGTGMSPWRMMNEWGIPTVYLESLVYQYLSYLDSRGAFVPDVAIAGGFVLEDQVFKGIALGAPYIKAVAMARAPLTAVMVGKTIGGLAAKGKLPGDLKDYGETVEDIFMSAFELRKKYGKDFARIPEAAIGLYSYFDRVAYGLKQFMCGARKFAINYISRDDIAALTEEAASLTGIPYVTELDREDAYAILDQAPTARSAAVAGS